MAGNPFKSLMEQAGTCKAQGDLQQAAKLFGEAMRYGPRSKHAALAHFVCAVESGGKVDVPGAKALLADLDEHSAKYFSVFANFFAGSVDEIVIKEYLECLAGFASGSEPDWLFFELFKDKIAIPPTSKLSLTHSESPIPRRVYLYFDQQPPEDVLENLAEMRLRNADFEFRLFNFESASDFLTGNFGHEHTSVFQRLEHPAAQSDFFRCHVVHRLGGYYLDVDERPVPGVFSEWLLSLSCDALFFRSRGKGSRGPLMSAFFGSRANDQILERAINLLLHNCLTQPALSMWLRTGPGVITRSVIYHFLLADSCSSEGYQVFIGEKSMYRKILEAFEPSYRSDGRDWRVFEREKKEGTVH